VIVLLAQDALPASDRWLAELTAPLLAGGPDERVAGAFARQRPRDDASAVTRYYLDRWVAASDTPRIASISSPEEFAALAPMDKFLRCAFDNVCSCFRRSVWEQHPFKATAIAEDIEWGRDVLLAGYRLAYAPQAVVIHSHDRPARYEFERTYVLHRRLFELFRLRTIPTLPALARAVASSLALHWRLERSAAKEPGRRSGLARALALAFAWPLGQYLGALSAVRSWRAVRSRMV
jgi:rhamnosyltransferase